METFCNMCIASELTAVQAAINCLFEVTALQNVCPDAAKNVSNARKLVRRCHGYVGTQLQLEVTQAALMQHELSHEYSQLRKGKAELTQLQQEICAEAGFDIFQCCEWAIPELSLLEGINRPAANRYMRKLRPKSSKLRAELQSLPAQTAQLPSCINTVRGWSSTLHNAAAAAAHKKSFISDDNQGD